MAMTVMNNPSAMMTLGELNKNVSTLGKQLKKVATGTKITGAGDGAAEYNIAEKMQAQIRSLAQDIENTRTGRSILKVAEGGIQGIVDELRDMKQLAINAANDTNTDADRAAIQKEFDEKLRQIDDIVTTTNYNGKRLLDGTYARRMNVSITQNPEAVYGSRGATATSVGDTGPAQVEAWPGADNVTNAVTITSGGAYTIPADYHDGTITISSVAAAGGVKLSQAGASLTNVNIVVEAPSSETAKLYINGLNISNFGVDAPIIQFQGNDNLLTLIGNSTLELQNGAEELDADGNPTGSFQNATAAVVDMGNGLDINGNGSSLTIINYKSSEGACIGTAKGASSSGDLNIISATLNLHSYDGAGIGSGAYGGSVGDINVTNSTVNLTGHFYAGIGSGRGGSSCGDIVVSKSNINNLYTSPYGYSEAHNMGSVDTCIGSGYSGSKCGNIEIDSSVVNASNSDSALVGAGDGGSICLDITVSNSDIIGYSNHGAGVGAGRGARAGNITIKNASKIQHESPDGAAIGSGLNGAVGRIVIDASSLDLLDATMAYTDDTHKIPGIGCGRGGTAGNYDVQVVPNTPTTLEGKPLMIHTGTKADQRLNCWIENLGTKTLFSSNTNKQLTDEALEEIANVRTRASAQYLLGSTTDPSIEGPLDKAINYVLGEMTQVGSYINRLDSTEDTLTINHENTISSESVIRDADMAKEMTEYTKSNVLAQASQSMLAQANQNSSSVLSLLQ